MRSGAHTRKRGILTWAKQIQFGLQERPHFTLLERSARSVRLRQLQGAESAMQLTNEDLRARRHGGSGNRESVASQDQQRHHQRCSCRHGRQATEACNNQLGAQVTHTDRCSVARERCRGTAAEEQDTSNITPRDSRTLHLDDLRYELLTMMLMMHAMMMKMQ